MTIHQTQKASEQERIFFIIWDNGIWGLRDMLSTTQTHKHFGNELVESQPKETENTEEKGFLEERPHLIPSLIAAAMLLGALSDLPYGYYQLLRFVVCGAGVFVAYAAYNWQKIWAGWLFGFIAVLFNPLIPIHLSHGLWQPIDVICALLFVVIALILKKPTAEKQEGE